MPIFDVPIQCDMHTSYDFVFQGAWHPDVSSFSADIEVHFELTGTMQLYHDQEFTDGKYSKRFQRIPKDSKEFQRIPNDSNVQNYDLILAFDGTVAIPNGKQIFVQSELEIPEEYGNADVRIHSCISSPGALENMAPVESNNPFWMLIDNGCINDSTVSILERGPNGQLRFSFEGFTFHNFDETEVSVGPLM